MNIVFVSGDSYPDGSAATNRHIAYSKGLIKLGHTVTFVLYSREAFRQEIFELEGIVFRGKQSSILNLKKCRKIRRFLTLISSIWNGRQIIRDIDHLQKIDVLVLLSTVPLELIPFFRLAEDLTLKVVHERTEYPFTVIGNSIKERIRLRYYLNQSIRQFDGVYVINNALKSYFSRYIKPGVRVDVINMIVDPTRFSLEDKTPEHLGDYIAYCGTMNSAKDGVDILVQAFAIALRNNGVPGHLKLLLIGDYDDLAFKYELEGIINRYNCQSNIIFKGKVQRDRIPGLLINASSLALARPENKIAEGGFPTKLGEYLATGKPVIITDTGEISSYLKDGESAFIALPGDIQSFSDKITEVYSDYERALKIGERGKELTNNEFNYVVQAQKLAGFFKSLQ